LRFRKWVTFQACSIWLMAEPATAPDHGTSPRRWLWWTIALLVVALLVAVGVALWLRQGTSIPPLAPTVVAGPPRFGDMPDLSAAATLPPDGTSSPTKSAARPVTGVFIEPGDGRAPILDEIQGARHSIDLEVYLVSDDAILRSLEEAPRRGVAVRVILEEQPFGGGGGQEAVVARLASAGIAVRWGNPVFRFSQVEAAPGEPSSEARIADTTWQVCR
jgi:phosphatidylserine/phosphatidylglycerophosphate/cardiolipin synthase-like enzyme